MNNPLDNLGDYNTVRIDLQNAGGNMDKLYKEVGDTAVEKAAPILLLAGAGLAGLALGLVHLGKKGIGFIKDRRSKIKNEASIKETFYQEVEAVADENSEKTNLSEEL